MPSPNCRTCGNPIVSKDRRAECNPCRFRRLKAAQPCACGNPKTPNYPTCRECTYGTIVLPDPPSADRIAWAAGLIEGEGTFVSRANHGGMIRVQMTDQDVIERLHTTFGVGRLATYTPKNPRHKQSWMWTIQRREYVFWVADQISPWLCGRRRTAAQRLLSNFSDGPTLSAERSETGGLDNPNSVAWLAGMIEGEGFIRRNQIAISSVDRDSIDRVHRIAGLGSVRSTASRRKEWRDLFIWQVSSLAGVCEILQAVRPWMLSRRTAKIDTILGGERGSRTPAGVTRAAA